MFCFWMMWNSESLPPRNSPFLASTTVPFSNTISWSLASEMGVTIHGLPMFSTIRRLAPELTAACSDLVESTGSNPHHDALASVTWPALILAMARASISAPATSPVNAAPMASSASTRFSNPIIVSSLIDLGFFLKSLNHAMNNVPISWH